jgi:hypothetical protein
MKQRMSQKGNVNSAKNLNGILYLRWCKAYLLEGLKHKSVRARGLY